MRIVLLTVLFIFGLTACSSIAKESAKGIVSQVVEDFDEYDLSDSVDEALAVGQQNGTSAFTYVGLALFTIGAVSFAFLARDAGLKLMACGALSGAVPYVVQSAYFSIIVNSGIVLILLIAIYHLWWKVRKSENAEEEITKP